jgi:hypothetical protein
MLTNDSVAHRIDRYRPRTLAHPLWALAAGPSRAVVKAARPTDPEDAKGLLSTLCAFLASPCGWSRDAAPDLVALLTDAGIEAFAAKTLGAGRTRENRVGRLRRLQRALADVHRIPAMRRSHRSPATTPLVRVHDACPGLPFAAVAQVFTAHTGAQVTPDRLRTLTMGLMGAAEATATGNNTGTVSLDSVALGPYLDAADLNTRTVAVRANQTRKTNAKPLSGRQQLAHDRADRAAYRRVQSGPRVAPLPDLDTRVPAVRAAIEAYRPQELDDLPWASLRPLTVQMVAGARPASVVSARNMATIVVEFLSWVWNLPGREDPGAPPSAIELLSSPLVEAYAVARNLQGRSGASRSTARTVLRRCVRSLDADHIHVSYPHAPVAPPYTPAKCAELAWLATSQPTAAKERNACYLLGLTLGAGLSSPDLRGVRRCHITERATPGEAAHLTVTVIGGDAPRTVPIRRQYEPLVRRALELSAMDPPDALVLGRNETRRNVTVVARHGIVTAEYGEVISIEPNRLRTTWLFACMNAAIPLADLLRLAGLRSARSLTDLLALCPPGDPDTIARGMLAVADATITARHQGVAL